jgi:hypothetical protein
MDDIALALDAALDGDHARAENDAALAFVERRPDDRFAMPVSSSMVMNMTPLADPGPAISADNVEHVPPESAPCAIER